LRRRSGNDSLRGECYTGAQRGGWSPVGRVQKVLAVGLPLRCPVCNFAFADARDSGFVAPVQCPYAGAPYPEICSLHDKIYFGKWRKMDAGSLDVLRAYRKIVHLLSAVGRIVSEEKDEPARRHLKQAGEMLDRALSYAHHAINELILRRGGRPHLPSDYEAHYDVVLPFKEDL
jgi:hypothetical protein